MHEGLATRQRMLGLTGRQFCIPSFVAATRGRGVEACCHQAAQQPHHFCPFERPVAHGFLVAVHLVEHRAVAAAAATAAATAAAARTRSAVLTTLSTGMVAGCGDGMMTKHNPAGRTRFPRLPQARQQPRAYMNYK